MAGKLTGRRVVLANEADERLALSKAAGGGGEHVGGLRTCAVARGVGRGSSGKGRKSARELDKVSERNG